MRVPTTLAGVFPPSFPGASGALAEVLGLPQDMTGVIKQLPSFTCLISSANKLHRGQWGLAIQAALAPAQEGHRPSRAYQKPLQSYGSTQSSHPVEHVQLDLAAQCQRRENATS